MRIFALSLLLTFIVGLVSCDTKAPKIKLNRSERNLVDSMYKDAIPLVDSLLDLQCIEFRKNQYQVIKDSIIAIRLSEIEEFLPK